MKSKKNNDFFWPDDGSVPDSAIPFSLKRRKSMDWVIKNWKRREAVVQAGGSYGVWPKELAKHYELVYSFEPEPTSFYFLCKNCPELNIIKLQMALGDIAGFVSMNRMNDTSHTVNNKGRSIPIVPIDNFRFQQCDALLLDVEGYELYALMGAANTIARYRPIILIEDRKDYPIPAVTWLEKRGYCQAQQIQGDRIFIHEKA